MCSVDLSGSTLFLIPLPHPRPCPRPRPLTAAISHWHSRSLPGSQSGARAKLGEKDFVALNREGVKSGLVTAKEHYQYRATHDIRRLVPARAGSTLASPPKIPDITFGAPTR